MPNFTTFYLDDRQYKQYNKCFVVLGNNRHKQFITQCDYNTVGNRELYFNLGPNVESLKTEGEIRFCLILRVAQCILCDIG